MLNRLTNVLTESQQSQPADSPWRVDRHPARRLVWLFCLLMLPLLAVSGRLIWIQTVVRQRFIEPWEAVRESIELIPSIDGRILSADGQVLAHDEVTFDVHVNYRWLEEPADPRWLRRQALARIEPGDRRDKELVESRQEELLELRRQLWDDLPRLLNREAGEIAEMRSRIQQRVERIVASVEQRRQADSNVAQEASQTVSDGGSDSLWLNGRQLWNSARTALTTAPRRQRADPVVIREELDDHLLIRDIPLTVAARIESHPERWPGLRIQTSTRRIYPFGSAASHLVGIRRPVTEEELAQAGEAQGAGNSTSASSTAADGDGADDSTADSLLKPGDRIGRTGVEKTADARIRGLRGRRQIVRNRQGDLLETRLLAEAQPGADVVLTVHLPLQLQLEELLDRTLTARRSGLPQESTPAEEQDPDADQNEEAEPAEALPDSAGGSLIVMDVQTGAVLAAASAPRVDLSQLQNPSPAYWQSLLNDARRPFFHRAVAMSLPPGSVFKPVTSVALMESGQWDPDEPFECRGFLDRPDRHRCYIYRHFGVGHGPVTLTDALCQSCNVYFFAGARQIGAEPVAGWARQFGFGSSTGIDLPGESGGNVPAPPTADPLGLAGQSRTQQKWYPGDTLGLAIGQSRMTVTPLQITRMMAAIANDGWLVTPHVIQRTGLAGSRTAASDSAGHRYPPRRIPGLTEGTLERVREGLTQVVASRRGTGYRTVRLDHVSIAGKTGTAEAGPGQQDHAWFAGYAPAERPRVAFAVVLEHAGSGSKAAGPLARELVQSLVELGILESTSLAER